MSTFSDRAYDYFLGKGFAPHQAAALAANAEWESGGKTTQVHDKGTGFGLYGFRDPEPGRGRRTDLFNWAKGKGLDPNDEVTQLQFVEHELGGSEKAAGDALRASTDLAGAQTAMMRYLRPQGYTDANPQAGHGFAQRYNLAAPYIGAEQMSVPVNGVGPGGSGVVAPTTGLLAATSPPLTGIDAEIADWKGYSSPEGRVALDKVVAEKAKGDKALAEASDMALGLGKSLLAPAPVQQQEAPLQAQMYRPKAGAVAMPNFTQMLAQQRLMRRA